MIYGVHPVLETVRAGKRSVEAIYLARIPSSADDLVALAENAGISIKSSSVNEISTLTGSQHHQGVAARVGPFPYADLDDLLFGQEAIQGPTLVLDQVQDPANLGNIIRSAECLGASGGGDSERPKRRCHSRSGKSRCRGFRSHPDNPSSQSRQGH